MSKKSIKNLVLQNILLLLPLIIYSIYKNGYLIYEKKLINFPLVFKPIYLILISIVIKIIIDLIRYRKIKIDFNLLYVILIAMIVPYSINIIVYSIIFLISYIIVLLLEKIIKFNKVCLIYMIIIIYLIITKSLEFRNPVELNYMYSFSFLDYLIGRNVGGIASISILFSLIAFVILFMNYYYKKDIPIAIILAYTLCSIIYYLFTNNSNLIINSELIFGSIFVSSLSEASPFNRKNQILYGILIGIISFIISISYNSIIAIYISTFILSLTINFNLNKKKN